MTKLLQQCFLFFIVVVIPGHNLGNSQVSVNRTIGPTLVVYSVTSFAFFSDFDSDAMILILIATLLADWLYFYLSVHNRPLLTFLTFISGI